MSTTSFVLMCDEFHEYFFGVLEALKELGVVGQVGERVHGALERLAHIGHRPGLTGQYHLRCIVEVNLCHQDDQTFNVVLPATRAGI